MNKAIVFKGYDGEFAKRLRDIMAESKTTQEMLAKQTGLTRQTISQYMDGSVLPNVEKLYKICTFFDLPSDYFLGLTNSKKPEMEDRYIQNQTGLTDEVIQKLYDLSHGNPMTGRLFALPYDFHLGVINYMLSNESFMSSFFKRLLNYYELKQVDATSEDSDFAEYSLLKSIKNLLDDIYIDFYKQIHLKGKSRHKPGRVRKSKAVDKKEK